MCVNVGLNLNGEDSGLGKAMSLINYVEKGGLFSEYKVPLPFSLICK